jgi:predicted phage tail protein
MKHIKGAGGGGKDGGGSARVPVESPDTLRSIQYAKIIDLVSEGEIEGLVDGLRSVYLDDVPLRNQDGTDNFRGVEVTARNGTQAQPYMVGFDGAEAETVVGVEVRQATPITRTISNTDTTAVRVTVGVPQLTEQNPETGDLGGTSIRFRMYLQNNGGGFVPVPLRRVYQSNVFADVSGSIKQVTVATTQVKLDVKWEGLKNNSQQVCTGQVEYRAIGDPDWIVSQQVSFTGKSITRVIDNDTERDIFGNPLVSSIPTGGTTTVVIYPGSLFNVTINLSEDEYEFRVVKLTGSGALSLFRGEALVGDNLATISGKTTSRYQRAYRIELPAGGPWDIRVERVTADSSSALLQNKLFFDSYTQIIDAKLRYPNSALVGIKIDSKQFNNIPVRGYEIKGIKVKIPSNYDPLTREYTGTWDGTFITAWTDNPAWVFYDIVTNTRYGLGEFIDESQVDKWSLYTIAQYCDQTVEDGFGGQEPRFTCNLYIQTREEAYKVVANIASIFRGIAYWSAGEIAVSQDAPSDPVQLFNKANIEGGQFQYAGSSGKVRHTVCLVAWNDPVDGYRQKIEYVADDEAIARYGVIQTEIVAVGCTSRGQAARIGRWLIYSEVNETETISFTAGMDTVFCQIGSIIQTNDPIRAGQRFGGRLLTDSTTTTINIDAPVTIESGKTYELSVVLPDGTIETKAVTNSAGVTSALTLGEALSDVPLDYAIWILAANDLVPESWRVISIAEVEKTKLQVTALAYRPDKYSAVEDDLILEPIPSSIVNAGQPNTPTNLQITESLYLSGISVVSTKAIVSWDTVVGANSYTLEYFSENENPVTISGITSNSIEIAPIQEGTYTFALFAVNALGRRSQSAILEYTISGKTSPPSDVENFQLVALSGYAHLTWNASTELDVIVGGWMRIRFTPDLVNPEWSSSQDIGPQIAGSETTTQLPLLTGSYLAKWVDSSGNESENEVIISSNAASLLTLNILETLTESPSFAGTRTSVVVIDNLMQISLDEDVDDFDLIDDIADWDNEGNVEASGTYLFDQDLDLGSVQTSRLVSDIEALGVDSLNTVDDWVDVDGQASFDGALINDVGIELFVRTTNDDPGGSPVWSAWQPFFVGDWTARAFEFKAELFSENINHNINVSKLAVIVDMPDRDEYGEDITSGTSTYTVTYSTPFKVTPALGITAQNMGTGDYYTITDKDEFGFDIDFFDSSATQVNRTFDYHAKGY